MHGAMWFCGTHEDQPSPQQEPVQQPRRQAYYAPLQQGVDVYYNDTTPQQQQPLLVQQQQQQAMNATNNNPTVYGDAAEPMQQHGYPQQPPPGYIYQPLEQQQQQQQQQHHQHQYGYNPMKYAADWLRRMKPTHHSTAHEQLLPPPEHQQQQQAYQQQQYNTNPYSHPPPVPPPQLQIQELAPINTQPTNTNSSSYRNDQQHTGLTPLAAKLQLYTEQQQQYNNPMLQQQDAHHQHPYNTRSSAAAATNQRRLSYDQQQQQHDTSSSSPFIRPHAPSHSNSIASSRGSGVDPILPGLPIQELGASGGIDTGSNNNKSRRASFGSYAAAGLGSGGSASSTTSYNKNNAHTVSGGLKTTIAIQPQQHVDTSNVVAVHTPPLDTPSSAKRRAQLLSQSPLLKKAMSPADALYSLAPILTGYERTEILNYAQIWFAGRSGVDKVKANCFGAELPNYGYDDGRGEYIVRTGDHIKYRYEVMDVLGKGSFGQVLKCWDHAANRPVAVKIIRNKRRFQKQALVEAKIVATLQDEDPTDNYNIVRLLDSFTFRNHFCLTFELLSINLYERIKLGNYKPASQNTIKRIALQVLETLCLLRHLNIIHCDIKPENILLRERNGTLIKVIDFGSSCYVDEQVFTYIQSRFYRAPEVILGLTYGTPIDMWSLGCVLAELHTGSPLFGGENEADQLHCIMEVLGLPPRNVLSRASRYKIFFDHFTGRPLPTTPNSRGTVHRVGAKTLELALGPHTDAAFIDFLKGCLQYEPERRLTPHDALHHHWLIGGTNGAMFSSVHQSSGGIRMQY